VYAVILFVSSNMISDGSELLLLVPSMAALVGSIVLPILGAVPDGAIVLFSGLGGDVAEAQEQLSVGVGALAGSTIMLLTLPWALSIFAGRVDLDDQGRGQYNKKPRLNPTGSFVEDLTASGINVSKDIPVNGMWMVGTALTYLVIQGPAYSLSGFTATDNGDIEPLSEHEKTYALIGMVLCVCGFMGYCGYMFMTSESPQNLEKIDNFRVAAIRNGDVNLSGLLHQEALGYESEHLGELSEASPLHSSHKKRFENVLRPFFCKYDTDGDQSLTKDELKFLFTDLGEQLTDAEFNEWMQKHDADQSMTIDFQEFVGAMIHYVQNKPITHLQKMAAVQQEAGSGDDTQEEDDEEMPEDLVGMSPDEQQREIKKRAFIKMALGTALVLLFSDPMVDCLSEIGARLDISAFYVSFVLAPLASNASELIASTALASKKTKKHCTTVLFLPPPPP
jgi:Ca2+/Na+ antiporter